MPVALSETRRTVVPAGIDGLFPAIFYPPGNSLQRYFEDPTCIITKRSNPLEPLVLNIRKPRKDLRASFNLSLDRERPATWGLEIGLGKDTDVDEDRILMVYKGGPGEESRHLSITCGFNKYFTLDFTTGLFYIGKTRDSAIDEVVEMQRGLLDLINNQGTFNRDLEIVQRGDEIVFYRLELDPNTNILGFRVRRPAYKDNQSLIIPARVRANI